MSDTSNITEETVREIAREEAREVHDLAVEDDSGEQWSLKRLMSNFKVTRRQALASLGLIAVGYAAPRAVAKVVVGQAEADPGDDLTVPGVLDAGAIDTDEGTINHGLVRGRNGERIDASKFSGADADARLDNALSAASSGDIIYLENADYGSRTISTDLKFVGTGELAGATITGVWDASSASVIYLDIRIGSSGELKMGIYSQARGCGNGQITATDDNCCVVACRAIDVTFESGTSNGIADALWNNSTVTDNGTNTIGDIG